MTISISNRRGAPLVRFPRGTLVDRYRLQRYIGHGDEGTAYLAEERRTKILRVVKFYRHHGPTTLAFLRLTALSLEKLRETHVAVRYHHMGEWFSLAGRPFAFIVTDYLDGPRLIGQIRRRWAERRALDLVYSLFGNLASAHNRRIAIGDFEGGNNIILVDGKEPVFCDIGVGPGPRINRDFAADIDALISIVQKLARRCGDKRQLKAIHNALLEVQDGPVTSSTMTDLLEWLTDF